MNFNTSQKIPQTKFCTLNLERIMIVVREANYHILLPIAQGVRQHSGFALVDSGSCARPVGFVLGFLILGEAVVPHLELPASPESYDIFDVIWNGKNK